MKRFLFNVVLDGETENVLASELIKEYAKANSLDTSKKM